MITKQEIIHLLIEMRFAETTTESREKFVEICSGLDAVYDHLEDLLEERDKKLRGYLGDD